MMRSMAEDREVRWLQFQRDAIFKYPPPPSPSSSPSGNKINPAVLFIIVIVAVLFFVSGLLHLLVRFLVKNPSSARSGRNPEVPSADDALQRQLQQLFNLHDSGVDQAFIDALPVFIYREIVGGSKEPFDCAVCLSEFVEKDKLRLLPMCGHAFHINCIDTWLLTNSTCPLCRGTLFNPGFSVENPMFDHDELLEDPRSGDNDTSTAQKAVDLDEIVVEKGTFPVRLGKFRKLNNGEEAEEDDGEASSSALDARRCYSMGSYQYVVGDTKLRVALNNLRNGRDVEKLVKPIDNNQDTNPDSVEGEGKRLSLGTKTDSFSISKIWLWSKKGKFGSSDSHV